MVHKQSNLLNEFKNSVSRETLFRLNLFIELLTKWNKSINLTSNNNINYIWETYILDCYYLKNTIKSDFQLKVVDFGSGNGVPGLILSYMLESAEIHLIESNTKKAIFLEEAARISNNKVIVHNERIERISNLKADIITARAFCDIATTIKYAMLHKHEYTKLYSFKGDKITKELEEAKKLWHFNFTIFPRYNDKNSIIVEIMDFGIKV